MNIESIKKLFFFVCKFEQYMIYNPSPRWPGKIDVFHLTNKNDRNLPRVDEFIVYFTSFLVDD